MSRPRNEDQRLLSNEEHELVSMTRHPAVKAITALELVDLVSRLRERRDRARDIASHQRHEMRAKVASAELHPASDNTGTKAKRDLLAAALKRANKELERRRGSSGARNELVTNAEKALAMKQAANEQAPDRPSSQTANEGMPSLPYTDQAPSGALDAEGHKVVLERSRKVR
jgi:hypothetical protein